MVSSMRAWCWLLLIAAFAFPTAAQADEPDVPAPEAPDVVLTNVGFTVTAPGEVALEGATVEVRIDDQVVELAYDAAADEWRSDEVQAPAHGTVDIELLRDGAVIQSTTTRAVPGWLSIIPPVLAIGMALVFRRVVPSLFLGVWVGAWIAIEFSVGGLFWGLLETFEIYVLEAVTDPNHAAIILFSLMIGGMVGIISKNGGTQGIVNKIVGWADTPERGQAATGILGLGIFFDDYANTLIVGNTMRPVTDKLRVSREKLAYVVDSTAAPIATIALVTTWIGFQVGLVGDAVAGIEGYAEGAYSIFLNSLLYNFYPVLAIFFVFAVALSRRDFGPMYEAEQRARRTGEVLGPDAKVDETVQEGDELEPKEDIPERAFNAIIPIVVLVGGVLGGLYLTGVEAVGRDAPLREVIGAADSFTSLLWGSLLGVIVAAALSIGQRILTIEETVDAWYGGLKAMLFAMIILVLAWALSDITEVLHTADYLVLILGEALPPGVVPAIVFVLAAATAFATGSSWGTMGILIPLIVPLTWAILDLNAMTDPEYHHIIYSSVSCVLAGSVWGDHCSPISDTTILSSMASGCDHIEHVRTQLPYALTVGVVAVLLGTLPTGFGFPWWLSFIIGLATLGAILFYFGKPIDKIPVEERKATVSSPPMD